MFIFSIFFYRIIIMEKHNYDLEGKYYDVSDLQFNRNPPDNYNLHDNIISYDDGNDHKILLLSIVLSYPIIYDKYKYIDGKTEDITIVVCPFTMASICCYGKYHATENIENGCLVISNGEHTFSVMSAYEYSQKYNIRIGTVAIEKLRNAFMNHTDHKYLLIENNGQTIMNSEYYKNNEVKYIYTRPPDQFHNKTIVYLLYYVSEKNHVTKIAVIVGRNAKKEKPYGYNTRKSGTKEYIEKYMDKLNLKLGYVMPVLWFAWKSFYPDAKIIYLT